MTNRLPGKPRGSKSRLRKTAMMGAAATALIAVVPSLQAAELDDQATNLQAAVRNILSVPMSAAARRGTIGRLQLPAPGTNAIVIDNGDDISVGDDQSALGFSSDQEDISLVNSGDLTGGIGIDVSTGANDLADAVSDQTGTYVFGGNYVPLYDDAGNPV